jgi:hypothetical protein
MELTLLAAILTMAGAKTVVINTKYFNLTMGH